METKTLTKTELTSRVKELKTLEKKEHNPYREQNLNKFKKELQKRK